MDVGNPATDVTSRYRHSSLWMDQLAGVDPICARPRLDGDRTVDVVVVGAGYTGLWTAYHLATSDVDLEILVIDAEIAGAGASSRNGGWCSGEVPAPMSRFPPSEMRDLYRAVWAGIDEIGAIVAREGIECQYTKGGSVTVATSEPQAMRLRAELAAFGALGFGADDHRWLTSAETVGVFGAAGVHGSVFTPHCAVVQPAGLVRGLASAVERAGVTICDGTPALRVEPATVETPWGSIRARWVLDCVEAYLSRREPRRRIPVYSSMIATEPLGSGLWDRIGLRERTTFADARRTVTYGQRTADGRLAFGGRGAPYRFGSTMDVAQERARGVHETLAHWLVELVPAAEGADITHTWGGAVAVPRDLTASVLLDRASGLGRAGGYVGAGVTSSYLAGATLADLVLGRDTRRTRLPWVGHVSPDWEPEPLRWLGVETVRRLLRRADESEFRSGHPSRIGRTISRLTEV